MKALKILFGILTIFTISFCNKSESNVSMNQEAQNLISSSAAVENGKDTLHKFVRTANLKFKVKNVINSTYDIEDIVRKQGGFVTITNLTNQVDNRIRTELNSDSLSEIVIYSVKNDITIRVPNTKLDTTLKEIARNIDFLDFRIIKAEDVALSILANKLTQNRASKNEDRVNNAIDTRGKKLDETTTAENHVLSKQVEADNAKIANLNLKDQINFSTIVVEMYQNQSAITEVKVNTNKKASFGSRLMASFTNGLTFFTEIILIIAQLWSFMLLLLCAFLMARFLKNRINYKK